MQKSKAQSQILFQDNNQVAQGKLWVLYLDVYWNEPGPITTEILTLRTQCFAEFMQERVSMRQSCAMGAYWHSTQ